MRQAGRYLPEYRKIRDKHSFLEVCHNPQLAAEVTRQPVEKLGFDAAILFSDILVIPEAFGVDLHFDETAGPILKGLQSAQEIENLPGAESIPDSLGFVKEAIHLLA